MWLRRCLTGISVVFTFIAAADAREWMNATGTQKYEAEFVELQNGDVKLRLQNGTIISVPLDELSPRGQDFARKSAAALTQKMAGPRSGQTVWVGVQNKDTSLKKEPTASGEEATKVHFGDPLLVLRRKYSWLWVRNQNGEEGWIHELVVCNEETLKTRAKSGRIPTAIFLIDGNATLIVSGSYMIDESDSQPVAFAGNCVAFVESPRSTQLKLFKNATIRNPKSGVFYYFAAGKQFEPLDNDESGFAQTIYDAHAKEALRQPFETLSSAGSKKNSTAVPPIENSRDLAKRYIVASNQIPRDNGTIDLRNSRLGVPDGEQVELFGLTFTGPCKIIMAPDNTVLTTANNVIAKDSMGRLWKSCHVRLHEENVFAFFLDDPANISAKRNYDLPNGLAVTRTVSPAKSHVWADATGTLKVEAEFIELKEGNVKVRLPNGVIKSVSLARLCQADQQFARQCAVAPDGVSNQPATEKSPDVAKRYLYDLGPFDLAEGDIKYLKDGMQVTVTNSPVRVASLVFSAPCQLKILYKDKTLIATKDGVTAEHADGSTWTSRKVALDGDEVFAFFQATKPRETTKYETTVGVLTRGYKQLLLSIKPLRAGKFVLFGLLDISPSEAFVVGNALVVFEDCTDLEPPKITLVQDKISGVWLATDGHLATVDDSVGLFEGHTIKVVGGVTNPIRIGGKSFDDTTVIIKNGKPISISDSNTGTADKVPGTVPPPAETKDRPATAKAILPRFNKTLNGTHEVRVLNPNNFLVTVGVRSGDSGKDFEVKANGSRESIFVPNGSYDIYFVYSDHPDDLYQGDSFSINGNGVQITITQVVDGNYGIRKVK